MGNRIPFYKNCSVKTYYFLDIYFFTSFFLGVYLHPNNFEYRFCCF